jgi:hypothetical protein
LKARLQNETNTFIGSKSLIIVRYQSEVSDYLIVLARKSFELLLVPALQPALKDSPMYILRALAFLLLTQAVLAQQPTPILPDPKLTPGDTFDVTSQDVCVHGYAKKVRAVPAWLKKQAYAEYKITQCKTC